MCRFSTVVRAACAAVAAGVLSSSAASASVVETDSASSGVFAVSNSDLVNGLTPTSSGVFGSGGNNEAFAGTDPAVLTNGQFGSANNNADTSPPSTLTPNNGST